MKAVKILLLAAVTLMTAGFAFAQTWMLTSAPIIPWYSVVSSSDGKTLLAEANQHVYTSTNSGVTWISNNVPMLVEGLSFLRPLAISQDGTDLFVCGAGVGHDGISNIYISTNSGATWTNVMEPSGSIIAASADGTKLVTAGDLTYIYTSTNSGITWSESFNSLPGLPPFFAIASSADGIKLAAVSYGEGIYISTNSGATWNQTDAPTTNWYSIASSADGSKLLAGGAGLLCLSTNAGATWAQADVPGYNWISVASSADGSRLTAGISYAGFVSPVFVSTDSGSTWNQLPFSGSSTNKTQLTSVAISADGQSVIATFLGNNGSGSIYRYVSPIPTLPTISISLTNFLKQQRGPSNYVALSWPSWVTNTVMQQNSNLNTASWTAVTNLPTLITNAKAQTTNYQVVLPLTGSQGFYRLNSP